MFESEFDRALKEVKEYLESDKFSKKLKNNDDYKIYIDSKFNKDFNTKISETKDSLFYKAVKSGFRDYVKSYEVLFDTMIRVVLDNDMVVIANINLKELKCEIKNAYPLGDVLCM